MAKERVPIARDVADQVLFAHDHTCCVCRERGKAVQIHHIDENPSNNAAENLAVLCLEDHDATQIVGGFGRKFTSGEIIAYRNDWIERVRNRREEADKIASTRMSGMSSKIEEREQIWVRPPEMMLQAYINHLPDLLREAFARARPEWDTGVTARMRTATSEVIEILERALVHLAGWYPPNHFGDKPADIYFSEYVASRYLWHFAINTPDEPGSGGTIAGVLAGGGALDDVAGSVAAMVAAQMGPEFDYPAWQQRWNAAKIFEGDTSKLGGQAASQPDGALGADTARVLIHMFKTNQLFEQDVGAMANALRMERSVLQYHLDRLCEAKFAESICGNYLHGHIYWALTPEGRRYVVEGKLN